VTTAFVEPELINARVGDRVQFERLGYYVVDPDSNDETIVFNRIVGLRETWAKIATQEKNKQGGGQKKKPKRSNPNPSDLNPKGRGAT